MSRKRKIFLLLFKIMVAGWLFSIPSLFFWVHMIDLWNRHKLKNRTAVFCSFTRTDPIDVILFDRVSNGDFHVMSGLPFNRFCSVTVFSSLNILILFSVFFFVHTLLILNFKNYLKKIKAGKYLSVKVALSTWHVIKLDFTYLTSKYWSWGTQFIQYLIFPFFFSTIFTSLAKLF